MAEAPGHPLYKKLNEVLEKAGPMNPAKNAAGTEEAL